MTVIRRCWWKRRRACDGEEEKEQGRSGDRNSDYLEMTDDADEQASLPLKFKGIKGKDQEV